MQAAPVCIPLPVSFVPAARAVVGSSPAIRPPSNKESNFFFALISEFLLTLLVSFTRRQRTGRIPFPPSIRVFMWKYCSSFYSVLRSVFLLLLFFTSVILYLCGTFSSHPAKIMPGFVIRSLFKARISDTVQPFFLAIAQRLSPRFTI